MYTIQTENKESFQKHLTDNGVQNLLHYPIPPHKQKAYEELNSLNFPIAEKIHFEIVSIPLSPTLKKEQVIHICNVINSYE